MFEKVGQWFRDSWEGVKEFVRQYYNSVFDMLKEVLYWLFDSMMDVSIVAMNSLGAMLDFNPADYFAVIPAEVANIIGLIGLAEALTMITVSIVIRMLLQLIPFVRLGS